MKPEVQAQLLELNRHFYRTVAHEFDRTRRSMPTGMFALVDRLSARLDESPRILDVGCGNGRFAWVLDARGVGCDYTGADNDEQLLSFARSQAVDLSFVQPAFVRVDIGQIGWVSEVSPREGQYDAIVSLAVLHHFPGYSMRRRVVQDLAMLLAPTGVLALSTWQFLTADRFVRKLMPWEAIGLTADDVEPGDALLPWNQGASALRYVHQLEFDEVVALADEVGLSIIDVFRADGKEGNLNLYVLLSR